MRVRFETMQITLTHFEVVQLFRRLQNTPALSTNDTSRNYQQIKSKIVYICGIV